MYPFSYSSLKVIHDQQIQEALERQCLYAGEETQRGILFQTLRTLLTRFTAQPRCEQEEPLPACAQQVECTVC